KSHWVCADAAPARLLANTKCANASARFFIVVTLQRSSGLFLVDREQFFSILPCLLEPVGRQLVADLLEAGLQLGARRHDLHAVRLELRQVPTALVFPHFPATRFRGRGRLEQSFLCWLVERVERRLVDE